MRSRRQLVIVMALGAAVSLTACTGPSDESAPSASATAKSPDSSGPANPDSPLVPVFPAEFTAQSAETESVRIADELVAQIDPATVVNDDRFSQEVAATEGDGTYWGVLHTLTLDPASDPAAQAETLASSLTEAGWIARDATNEGGVYLIALSSSEDGQESWFVVVGADTSVPGQSVVSLQLASPNLP